MTAMTSVCSLSFAAARQCMRVCVYVCLFVYVCVIVQYARPSL